MAEQWISVSNQLPEEEIDVLVTDGDRTEVKYYDKERDS